MNQGQPSDCGLLAHDPTHNNPAELGARQMVRKRGVSLYAICYRQWSLYSGHIDP
ncbi:MAG: hypothetical protein HXX08_00015 [Chloroflexi bacterium]|uniref:Uncharacterized protein n=1 Tax=Candidatus Chlorohelix allophototropha TaxID=3003348 RepID=A0A8T7LTS8_9CHLR|nr:hypothetical protein [Chloroflexota bacterium]WJW66134.1 hypothetical protein OZ401_001923 [Chloroflexota bacterium L227-S17]